MYLLSTLILTPPGARFAALPYTPTSGMLATPGVVPVTATPGRLLITLAVKIIENQNWKLTIGSLNVEIEDALRGII